MLLCVCVCVCVCFAGRPRVGSSRRREWGGSTSMWGKGGGGVIGVDIGLTLGGLIERRRLGGVGIRLVEGGVGLGRSHLAITRRLLASAQTLSAVAYEARLALRPVTATVCVCVRDPAVGISSLFFFFFHDGICSTSLPRGNQVDGLPRASHQFLSCMLRF